MTDIQRTPTLRQMLAHLAAHCGGEVVFLPGDRVTLTGTPGEVGQLLAAINQTGRLVASSTPAATGFAGQVLVNVRLAPRVQIHAIRQAAPKRRLPRWGLWAIGGGVIALIAGIGWFIHTVVTAVAANLPVALVILGVVVAVIVLVAKSGGGTTFSGTFKGRID